VSHWTPLAGRIMLAVGSVVVLALATAACGKTSPAGSAPASTQPPALAQVSTAPAVPPATAPPGPAIKAACPLVSPARVAAILGVPQPVATERPAIEQGGSALYTCHYQSGGQWVEVLVTISQLTGSADQAASLAIRRYTGTIAAVPGVGDAAYYTDSALSPTQPRPEGLVTARAEGRQMRVITLSAFLGGSPKPKVIALARTVLERI
jgi:hypothetical protein